MPFTTNPIDSTKIHYEVEGSGPPLLLVHGFSGSLQGWTDYGYVDALKDDYRLVMYDMRAHGDSGHPHGLDSYTPELHVNDALAVLHELRIDRAHYFGYSFGSWIGYSCLKYAPSHLLSFIGGGSDPYRRKSELVGNILESRKDGLEAALAAFEARNGRMSDAARANYLKQDPDAQIAAITVRSDTPGLSEGLGSITQPVLANAGSEDGNHEFVEKAAGEMPTAEFVSLGGLDHGQALMRSDTVLPHVTRFLAGVESARALV
ncbi:MAG: alpha/beta hydrolase [Dehalococcoidia bacterium]|jgi:pimeloyl-ACP methyl ester carboxylesterase|nr:alpha/beta hydrolase [Dehalococcoidia bacterium]